MPVISCAQQSVIAEYPTLVGSSPGQITAGPDDALWFTESLGAVFCGPI
jgi:streptogramin lyase